MLDKQILLKLVNQPEEKLLFAKVLDQADFSLRNHKKTFSQFIDPAKCSSMEKILCKILDLKFLFFGGQEDCERKMIGFAPDYMELFYEIFPISIIQIKKNNKFSEQLNHRDYLGSILGLGIDRSKIGDIILLEEYAVCYVHNEIAEYICFHLQKVSHTKVEVTKIENMKFCLPEKNLLEKHITVASLRVDCIISAGFQISRGKSQDLIQAEKVNANWNLVENPSFILKEGDIVSLRGYGKIKILEINGKTRKGKISLIMGKYG